MKRLFTTTFITLLMLTISSVASAMKDGYSPCAVSNMQCTWESNNGTNNVVITFNAPTQVQTYDSNIQNYVYEELNDPITKIVVERMTSDFDEITPVATFTSPEKGASLTCTDTGITYGKYYYRAVVYAGDVNSNPWDWTAIKEVVVGQIPADFQDKDVSVTTNAQTVIIKFTAPSLSSRGEAMTMPMTVTIAEMTNAEPPTYSTRNTITNAVPGQEYTVELNNVKNGIHTYALQASTASGANNGSYRYCTNVYVGQDVPGNVQNAKAKATDEGILVTWNAPARGQNGGDQGNVADITYTVTRKTSPTDEGTVVANAISETSYLDTFSSTEDITLVYEITAQNAAGSGFATTTNSVFLGTPLALPFTENFETPDAYGNIGFDKKWEKSYDGYYCTWYTSGGPFYVNDNNSAIKPHQGNGLAYAMYSSWGTTNKWDAITSEYIDFSKAKAPVLSFWLYDIGLVGSDMTLSVQTSTDGIDFTSEEVIPLGEAPMDGWRQIKVALNTLKSIPAGMLRLRTDAHGSNCYAVVIDEVLIEDTYVEPDPEPDPIPDPMPTDDALIKTSDVNDYIQLEALGMSENHRYITGLNIGTFSSFIWDTVTDEVIMHDGDHLNSDFRAITDDGHAYGILSPDGSDDMMDMHASTFGLDGIAQTIDEEGMTALFDVTPDGSVAVGSILDEMWLPTPCIWKDGKRVMLPVPSMAECGFEHSGAQAMFVSNDASIIAGYLQDWHSSRPAILWRLQEDGTYKADVISKGKWELFPGQGNEYLRFEALGLSSNGKWLALSIQKETADGGTGTEHMARMNLETGEIQESKAPYIYEYNAEEQNYYPSAISDDGTCVGSFVNFDGRRQGMIWFGNEKEPRFMADVFPQFEQMENYDFYINCPVSISADGNYIAGYGCPIVYDEDGADYYFESYLININGEDTKIKVMQIPTDKMRKGIYNIAGQRVNTNTKGIIIKDGKKILK